MARPVVAHDVERSTHAPGHRQVVVVGVGCDRRPVEEVGAGSEHIEAATDGRPPAGAERTNLMQYRRIGVPVAVV